MKKYLNEKNMYRIYTVAIEVTIDARPLSLATADCNRNALHIRCGTPDGLSTSDVDGKRGSSHRTFRHSDI